ncbi:hypothetical protein B0J17DRAFT_741285, partial [Rhizoctonia solani]
FHPYQRPSALLQSCIDFHSSQAKGAPIHISVYNDFVGSCYRAPAMFRFTIPFKAVVRSLEFQWIVPNSSPTSQAQAGKIITTYLQASSNSLNRLALNVVTEPSRPIFLKCNSEEDSHRSLRIDLPRDHLENALASITDLWLRGAYPSWDSKACWGLFHFNWILVIHARSPITNSETFSSPVPVYTGLMLNWVLLKQINLRVGRQRTYRISNFWPEIHYCCVWFVPVQTG